MKNRYGVDENYFRKELTFLLNSLSNRTPEELYRYFMVLARTVEKLIPEDQENEKETN